MKQIVKNTFLCLLFPLSCAAGGFQVNTQGQKALGMGGAFTGIGSDASSVYFNPGAIALLPEKQHYCVGANLIFPKVAVRTAAVPEEHMTSPAGHPIFLYCAGRINQYLSFGMGVNNQFGSTSSYPNEWQGKFIVQKLALKTFMYQPTVSFNYKNKVGVGLGYVYSSANFEYNKAIPIAGTTTEHGEVSLTGSAHTTGYNMGVFCKPMESVAVGFSYRTKLEMPLNQGMASFSDIPSSLTSVFPETTRFNSSLTLPAVLSAGVAFHPDSLKKMLIAFDVVRTYWSSYDTLRFDFENETTPDSKVTKDWHNTMTYRLGIAYKIKPSITLRAGTYYDETPVPEGRVSPETPDNNTLGFTMGIGLELGKHYSLDASWLHNALKRTGTLDEEGFSAEYHRRINLFGLSMAAHF